MLLPNKDKCVMFFCGKISENWVYELAIWGEGWDTPLSIDISIRTKGDHPGFFTCWLVCSKKLFELNIYDIRHHDDD